MQNRQVRLLPVLIMVATLAFSVRLVEVYTGLSRFSGVAFAEEKSPDLPPPPSQETLGGEAPPQADATMPLDDFQPPPEWRDASDGDIDVTGVKMELLQEVAERRKRLDEQERNIKAREALLQAATQELDRKYRELEKLRKEIEVLLGKQSEEEQQRIVSLVKIYEGMKPQDAARIFDTLDLDVLVAVMSKMSERKISPILAAMSAERARTVTIMLAEQRKLPVLP